MNTSQEEFIRVCLNKLVGQPIVATTITIGVIIDDAMEAIGKAKSRFEERSNDSIWSTRPVL